MGKSLTGKCKVPPDGLNFQKLQKRKAYHKKRIGISGVLLAVCLLLFSAAAVSPYPSITNTELPDATVGLPYSVTLSATGNMPMEWFVKSGDTLPDGITINKDTGAVSGIPQESGVYEFEIIARNYDGTDSKTFNITVRNPALAPVITTTELDAATQESVYSFQLQATGAQPITWKVSDGSILPDGLELSDDGEITGMPTDYGSYSFYITAGNFDGTHELLFKLKIFSKIPNITTAGLPSGQVGYLYNTQLAATGKAPLKWSIIGNVLPKGLTLNAGTGVISGTPQEGGVFHFLVQAENSDSAADTASLTITVAYPPNITSSVLADGKVGIQYSRTLSAEGNKPLLWSVTEGSLPDGLTLHAETGLLSGTPTAVGSFTFTVTVANNDGHDDKQFKINVFGSAPVITSSTLPNGTDGKSYSASLSATGTGPITWSYTGSLPEGLSMNTVSGLIYGTPTATGSSSFTVRATNAEGYSTQPMTIVINPASPVITNKTLPSGIINNEYEAQLFADGTGPFTWYIEGGSLPDGLYLDNASGKIMGTPNKLQSAEVTIKAVNAAGSATATFTIGVLTQFTDLEGSWAINDIYWAYAHGLFQGATATTFEPRGKMTRAMFVAVLHRYAGEPVSGSGTKFTDITGNPYYASAVAWASSNGIVYGTSADKFSPHQNITREELVVFLYRYGSATGRDMSARANLGQFTDGNTTSNFAKEAMQWAVAENIMAGITATNLSPKGTATREQATAFFRRFIESY